MNLDGAENAKAEVFLKAFKYSEIASSLSDEEDQPVFVASPGTEAHDDIVQARRKRKFDPKELIAVGIVKPKDQDRPTDGLKLGIFIQRRRLIHHPVVEAAKRIAGDEARVIVTGPVRRQAPANTGHCRPLRMGASVGHHRVTVGTIGCFGVSRDGSGVGILSNNHVLAHTNKGLRGDLVLQPGRVDCGPRRGTLNQVATLHEYVPIDFAPGASNLVDCAFALLSEGIACDGCTMDVLSTSPKAWAIGEPEELIFDDVPVQKVGRTTGFTEGTVEAIGVNNVKVQMIGGPRPRYALFNQQVAVAGIHETFSKGGDSGSLICTRDGRPVALLFAGTKTGGRHGRGITYANPIHTVLDSLEIDIYAGG
ncbi:hypothetical protein [Methylobacterium soli]|uniref:Serine protease n=1 Tax=Methylobacterium soli TaxID=553447 RepID=A0A6L3SWG2_9HYPH|nr:hypothetical protein [Methylobacterium soli]KAB1076940.1 hypothetical protein F6X53_21035 [Methylobacterium soli]GJE41620.1 hypothetical protein AEGHOMDF_0786 [Methylobacterium soli]